MTAPPFGGGQWPSSGGYDVRNDKTWHGYGQTPASPYANRNMEARQFQTPSGQNRREVTSDYGGPGWQPPPQQPPGGGGTGGGGTPGGGSGGGWYGDPDEGGTQIPGTTTPPTTGTPGTATGPLYSKSDTDHAVSQAAASAFGAADAYSLKTASSGNGLSYGAAQAGQINPLIAQAGVGARTAAKSIPIQDALANQSWLLGNQTNQARDALDAARLGEYRNQTGQMGSDYFTKLLTQLLGSI